MGKEGRNPWSYILIIEVLKVKKTKEIINIKNFIDLSQWDIFVEDSMSDVDTMMMYTVGCLAQVAQSIG